MSDSPIIVIDNGSHTIRADLAGKFEPLHKFPSHVTEISHDDNLDWNGLEKLYQHLLYEKLAIDQDKHKLAHHIAIQRKNKVFLTNSPFTSNKIKSKISEMLFEKFECDGVYFGITSNCSLYSTGKTTGLTVDSGYKSTYIAPIFEGYMIPLFTTKLNYGGFTLDVFLRDLINSKSRYQITLQEAERIKIDTSYVAMDSESESRNYPTKYALPDGKKIKMIELYSERFQPVELMFNPSVYNDVKNELSLPYAIHQSIMKGDHTLHKEMFDNIVLSGGNTMIKGMKQRLDKDVTHLAPASMNVTINASPQRGYASWTGASVMASHSEMKDIWITPQLYREQGPFRCFNIRCF